jgi:beta-glucosidase
MQAFTFPSDFLWGVATSAYQIEGAVSEDGRKPSIWDQFAATPGKVFQGETGAVAADHYHRMPSDVALMADMHLGAYRFSIAWPRVLPDGTGAVNTAGLDFYDRLVDALLARGITPMATLYHWDLPLALHNKGGWLNRDTAYAFADYAETVARRLGDRVSWWLTHNEPWCAAYLGYGSGVHAPGMEDMPSAFVAAHHLLLSHGLAMPRLRALTPPGAQLGLALNLNPVYASDNRPETLRVVAEVDDFNNRWFLDPIFRGTYPEALFAQFNAPPPPIQDGDMALIATPIDYLGVNYYSRAMIPIHLGTNPVGGGSAPIISSEHMGSFTDMGWEIYPPGLFDLLQRVHRDYAPKALVITENGAAFTDSRDAQGQVQDPRRAEYIREHIQAMARVLASEIPLKGYLVWSFLDNFEWAEGYSKRFGIVYVDFATQERVVKESGHWYAQFVAAQRGK